MHTYIHTYIHTYMHTYMHACMHACMQNRLLSMTHLPCMSHAGISGLLDKLLSIIYTRRTHSIPREHFLDLPSWRHQRFLWINFYPYIYPKRPQKCFCQEKKFLYCFRNCWSKYWKWPNISFFLFVLQQIPVLMQKQKSKYSTTNINLFLTIHFQSVFRRQQEVL